MSHFHVVVETRDKVGSDALLRVDLENKETVINRYVKPYINSEGVLFLEGAKVDASEIKRVRVFETEECGKSIIERGQKEFENNDKDDCIILPKNDVDYIIEFCEKSEITDNIIDSLY